MYAVATMMSSSGARRPSRVLRRDQRLCTGYERPPRKCVAQMPQKRIPICGQRGPPTDATDFASRSRRLPRRLAISSRAHFIFPPSPYVRTTLLTPSRHRPRTLTQPAGCIRPAGPRSEASPHSPRTLAAAEDVHSGTSELRSYVLSLVEHAQVCSCSVRMHAEMLAPSRVVA
jgi:hypothetical protein